MTGAGMDLSAYLDAASEAIGLPIAPERRAGTLAFLALAADMAATLERVPLDDGALDLAPAFLPPDLVPDLHPDFSVDPPREAADE